MDIKEAERVVIAKPVASRPTSSSFKSFTDILASAFNTSPPNSIAETTIATIKPKPVRFKPKLNPAPLGISEANDCRSSDKVSVSDRKSTVLFKPLAKYVSKRAISQLSIMRSQGDGNIQNLLPSPPVQTHIQCLDQDNDNVGSHLNSNLPWNIENNQSIESSRVTLESNKEDSTSRPPQTSSVQPSYDGYNWRKYGQKQVKGSEYPRSYYKCTHPNCPVKKKVERSLGGQIAEMVYKGEHNHPKPQPVKPNSSETRGVLSLSNGIAQDNSTKLWFNYLIGQMEGCERSQNESTCEGKVTVTQPFEPVTTGDFNAFCGVSDHSCGLSVEFEERSTKLGSVPVGGKLRSKKMGSKNPINEAGASVESEQEHHTVQCSADAEVLGKGFRWRKYGQKVVKGNLYPRSYYRCTVLKCKARKYVERASDDPKALITTYEGKHNHDISLGNASHETE